MLTPFYAQAIGNAAEIRSFSIIAQPADQAIKELARQAHVSVIFPSSLIKDITSNPVEGDMALSQALEILLAGTPLQGRISDNGMITIKPEDIPIDRKPKRQKPLRKEPVDEDQLNIDKPKLETLLVTGSNIRGNQLVGGHVMSISADELLLSNALTAADYLRQLPLNLASGVGMAEATLSSQDFGPDQANLSAGQGVNLRGLGALSTLVLLNGRRMASAGQYGDYVDISHIPLVAIAKIEILLNGASAIYGSDAVAGVVNIITHSHFERPQTNLSYGETTSGGGYEKRLSHAFTHFWDSGSLTFGGELYSRSNIKMTSRKYYANGSDFSEFGGVNWQAVSLNVSPQTTLFYNGVSGANAVVGAVVPSGNNANLTMADLATVSDDYVSDYNVYSGRDLLPAIERYGVFANFEQDITSRLSLRMQGMANYRRSFYQLGYPITNSSVILPTSPYYISDIDSSLAGSSGAIAFGKVETAHLENSRASVLHLSGSAALYFDLNDDWQLQSIISHAGDYQRRLKYGLRDGNGSGIIACSLGNTSVTDCDDSILPYNPFSTEAMSDVLIAQLYGEEDLHFDSEVLQTSVKLDGTLFSHRFDGVKMALGVDYRREKIDGELITDMLSIRRLKDDFAQTTRNTFSLYGEWLLPLSDNVDMQVAGRYEDFSGTGNYNTFDPKIGWEWRLTNEWSVQGAWGTSFHAPAMRYEDDSPQLSPGGNAAYTLNLGRFGPCDSDLVTFNGIIGTPGTAGEQCSMSVLVISGGAGSGKLKPEESQNLSLGLTYTVKSGVLAGFTSRLKYFDIEVNNRIQRIQSGTFNQILSDFFASGDTYDAALFVNPSEAAVQAIMDSARYIGTYGQVGVADSAEDITMIVDATQRNAGALRERGIDVELNYQTTYRGLDIGMFASSTYLLEYATQAAAGKPFVNFRNRYLASGAPAAFKSRQGIRLGLQNWQVSLTGQFVGAYKCSVCYETTTEGSVALVQKPTRIDSWLTWNMNIKWQTQLNQQDVGLSLNINNVLDVEAPFVDAGTGINDPIPEAYDFANHTGIGRTISLNAQLQW